MANPVAFILKGYPRLSETFIAQEIRALEKRGLAIHIFSLRHPTEHDVHPIHHEIQAPVTYLPEYLYQEPVRVLRAWRAGRKRPGYRAALTSWARDLCRDPTANRVRRFGQALVLANEIAPAVRHLHAHFLHTPASVARYTSLLTGLPWSCSAHAKDIWTLRQQEKAVKLAECQWLVTCTAVNQQHLRSLAVDPGRVELLYHGLDLARFAPPTDERPARDGRSAHDPVVILSVGRAVEKKGYADLLRALAALPEERHWRFIHVGGGPLLERLKRLARTLGITERLSWQGPQPQQAVLQQYRAADVFVLACRVTDDGDRDGLPNVLMEAQSQRLACLSTRVSGVPELITDEVTGLLVPQGNVVAFAAALDRLISDPPLRGQLGDAGFQRVRQSFSFDTTIDQLASKFGLPLHTHTA